MSDYVVTTDFLAKDALAPGNPSKVIKGSEFDVEFDAIAVAVATKANIASPTFTGTPAAPTAAVDTNTTQLATTAYVIGQGYAKLASPTFTGTVTAAAFTATGALTFSGLTASTVPYLSAGKVLTSSAVTPTELGYLSGVSSAIQTQLNAKYGSGSNVTLGTVSCGAISGTTAGFSGALTALSLQATSSRTLKQHIKDVTPGALQRVLGWDVKEYEFKALPGEREVGLIAEDADTRISTGKAIKTNVALFELAAAVQELAHRVGV